MKIIAQLQLQPTDAQADALKRTLAAANSACDYVSEIAWSQKVFKKFDLQKLCYTAIRDTYKLSAQLAIRVIAKTADAYKLDKRTKRVFKPLGSIAYDDRILSYALPGRKISIWTLDGRLSIPFVAGERQLAMLATRMGETDLVFHRGEWYLLATCEVSEPDPSDVDGVLGIDLGMVMLATDSDGESHTGESVEKHRQRHARVRAELQSKDTKSAKRKLKQISGKQQRFQKDVNHCISKRIVAKAERTKRAIALEDLKGIRQRARVSGPEQRARHSNWAFAQLRQYISYKAHLAGIPVILVDPAYTSRTCAVCGCNEKSNRKSQAQFLCVRCGHADNADRNAAINISRAAVIQPIVSKAA